MLCTQTELAAATCKGISWVQPALVDPRGDVSRRECSVSCGRESRRQQVLRNLIQRSAFSFSSHPAFWRQVLVRYFCAFDPDSCLNENQIIYGGQQWYIAQNSENPLGDLKGFPGQNVDAGRPWWGLLVCKINSSIPRSTAVCRCSHPLAFCSTTVLS